MSAALFDAAFRGFDVGAFPQFGPTTLAAGDLDGDGDRDLVVGRWFHGGPGVSVLLNQGDGSYGTATHYNLPSQKSVGEVQLADFDADGDLDVFATVPDINGLTNILAVYRNNGDGSLAARVEYTAGPGPLGLVIADFTGDGKADVVTANSRYITGQSGSISLLAHNGLTGAAAGFQVAVQYTTGIQPQYMAAADLNGDGHRDIALVRDDYVGSGAIGVLEVLFNNGSGGFGAPISYPVGGGGSLNSQSATAIALATWTTTATSI